MRLAVLPRYLDLNIENNEWNQKLYINRDFDFMARELGLGLCAILSPYDCEDFCSMCDGLIIPGSPNKVNPSYYGKDPMNPPPVYDEFSLGIKVIDCFVKNNKPVFGICAGHQAINIYFGGTMDYITNDGTRPHYKTVHSVNIKKDSFVYDAFKTDKAEVNSYHVMHIDKLGEGLEVVAESDEGIIEAVENKERKIFGVQWHPEMSFREKASVEKKLFENFIECCRTGNR